MLKIFRVRSKLFKSSLLGILIGIVSAVGLLIYDGNRRAVEATDKMAATEVVEIDQPTEVEEPDSTQEEPAQEESNAAVAGASTRVTAPAPPPNPAPAYDRISIPAAGVNTRIISVGMVGNNVDTPRNTADVGWWNGSAWFGGNGAFATFLVGHTPGVFAGLRSLGAGATITVTLADGAVINYQVVAVETLHLDDPNLMIRALTPRGNQGMNLMTCAGSYDTSRGTYDHRTIVYTIQV